MRTHRPRRALIRRAAPLLAAPLLALLLGGCGDGPAAGGGKATAADAGTAAPVEVSPAVAGTVRDGLEGTGTVEARYTAILRARVGGTLAPFTLDEGSPVKADARLLRVERPEVGAVLSKARAQHEKARRDAKALEALKADGLVPAQEVEEARFAVRQARLEVERLQDERALEVVTSPIDGVITSRAVQPGEAVSPGAELFRVADLTTLEVHLRLPERHLPRLKVGQPVEVHADGLGEAALVGTVDRIAPVVDPTSGTARVTVALGDGQAPGGGQLRPGMYVRCRVIIDVREGAVRVPRRALVQQDDRVFLYIARDGKARRTPVTLGYADGDQVQALTGVAPGDAVIVFGHRGLDDGAEVKPVAAPGAAPGAPTPAPGADPAAPAATPDDTPRARPRSADGGAP